MEYFEELKQNQGGILSFNGFVSTSRKQNVGYEFAQRSLLNGFSIAILFRIKIDPKTTSIPFISLENLSSNPSEYEVLLSFKSIFSIELIEQIENNLWQIDLTLTDKISPYIKIENEKFNHLIDYEKLGELLIEMNELNKAKDLYEINLPNNTDLKYTYIYNQLGLIYTKLEIYNQAILYYNLSLKTKLNDYVKISNIHKEIGKIFYKQNKIRDALEKFQYALDIQLEHLSSTDLSLISTYEFLGMIFEENEDYETALEYYQKQFDIQKESSLLKQSDLALNHFKIAICLENLNRFDEAMEHIQQSIDISPSDDLELNDRQAVRERIREQLE
jgi:tetratricopeptide (TPR) repeat protein